MRKVNGLAGKLASRVMSGSDEVVGYDTKRYVPGIVLFLEIRRALGIRRGGFLLGCLLAAILGLLAHPIGHLIQTGC